MRTVVERAKQKLESSRAWLEKERAWIADAEGVAPQSTSSNPPTAGSPSSSNLKPSALSANWHEELVKRFCADSFQALNDNVLSLGRARFFIALDECGVLDKAPDSPRLLPINRISLIAMQRILKAMDSLKLKIVIWFLLLDTSSKALLPTPSGAQAGSLRLKGSLAVLWPFVYLGFNQMARGVSVDLAEEVLAVDHLRLFGRPVSALETCLSLVHLLIIVKPHPSSIGPR